MEVKRMKGAIYLRGNFYVLDDENKLIMSEDGIFWGETNDSCKKNQGEIVSGFYYAVADELNKRKYTTIWQKIKKSWRSICYKLQ
jgi:hypothetical protein